MRTIIRFQFFHVILYLPQRLTELCAREPTSLMLRRARAFFCCRHCRACVRYTALRRFPPFFLLLFRVCYREPSGGSFAFACTRRRAARRLAIFWQQYVAAVPNLRLSWYPPGSAAAAPTLATRVASGVAFEQIASASTLQCGACLARPDQLRIMSLVSTSQGYTPGLAARPRRMLLSS